MLPLRCRQSLHLSQFHFAGCKTATVLRIGKSGNARAVATAVPVEGSNKQKQPVRSLPQGGKRFDSVDAEARRPAQQRGLLLLWTIAGARKLGIRWIPCFGAPFSFAEGRFCVDSQNSHPAFLGGPARQNTSISPPGNYILCAFSNRRGKDGNLP